MGLWIVGLTVGLFVLPIFGFFSFGNRSDHTSHLGLVLDLIERSRWQPHFLYHLAVGAASGWQSSPGHLAAAGAVVLTLAAVARTLLTYCLIDPEGRRPVRTLLFCWALLLAMPLWNWWKFPIIYLGQVTPNVWHNPTFVFAMPFTLALFMQAARYLREPTRRNLAMVGLLMPLNAVAKPNYLLAFGPCWAMLLGARCVGSFRIGWAAARRAMVDLMIGFGPAVVALWIQYVTTFTSQAPGGQRIVLAPLNVWSLYSPNIPASILLGIAFPLATLIGYPQQTFSDSRLILAWAVLAVAILQFALLSETARMSHANFAWGSYMADHVLFALCCSLLHRQRGGPRYWIAVAVLALHVLAGSFYLVRLFNNPNRLAETM
jgi:hypothetical protein